jgi:hypothetical protein
MRLTRLLALYRRHFRDHRRERMFLASLSFSLTIAVTRLLVHGFRASGNEFQLWIGGIHMHHLVWGILLLLLVGYLWLVQVGTGSNGEVARLGRTTALLYGVGAALTLDEFALWLNLKDVYWEREGRASIDAILSFGALISAGLWGGPFLRAVTRQASRVFRLRALEERWRARSQSAPGASTPIAEPAPELDRSPALRPDEGLSGS